MHCLCTSIQACAAAVQSQHCAVLKWLHENGCPLDTYITAGMAAQSGACKCLAYILDTEAGAALSDVELMRLLNAAGASGQIAGSTVSLIV